VFIPSGDFPTALTTANNLTSFSPFLGVSGDRLLINSTTYTVLTTFMIRVNQGHTSIAEAKTITSRSMIIYRNHFT